ncbi:dihydrofolate reductase family protein [Nocardioides anomalus]|uniref:Dihydrofolate reductase family protein n=1 Tax=Nocardioides anomalus TaxID=2712223 RepID=A0A6G6WH84_9ACTN|nr:dihydrofolate reductase family protein [Nocardioides anomalus]QIG44420.1 dihydrofolate reductase family protein [Nocardioides anomalus]
MGRIVVSTNMTLDGVTDDPAGDEGRPGGGWFLRVTEEDRAAWAATVHAEATEMAAYLIGGRTYEWFARRWVGRDGEQAARFNATPKYVVRTTPGRTDWGPTTELSGDVLARVAELKASVDGDIALYASYRLVTALLAAGLVDEVRLIVFPALAGGGGRLVTDLAAGSDLRLLGSERIGQELVRLRYRVAAVPA